MSYCFMRMEKINIANKMKLVGLYNHNFRKNTVANADPSLSYKNEELVKMEENQNYLDAVNERINNLDYYTHGGKIRKNAVLAFDVLMTFSKEASDQLDIQKWKQDNLKWLKDTFDKNEDKIGSNLIHVVSHEDESTVHIHAIVTPIDERGRLNAFSFTAGPNKMRSLQNSYAKQMECHGLERGIKGTRATHYDMKTFYKSLKQTFNKHLPLVKPYETAEEYRERADELYVAQNLKILGLEKENERLKTSLSSLRTEYNINLHELEQQMRKEEEEREKKYKLYKKNIREITESIDFVKQMNEKLNAVPEKMRDDFLNNLDNLMNYSERKTDR